MTPPTVLLERTFLEALVDAAAADHVAALQCYARLLDDYVAQQVRVRARADHLEAVDRMRNADLLAPLEVIHVAGQYRRQAARLGPTYSPDLALTLVIMRRESIRRIATFDDFFDSIDVTVER